MFCVCIQRFGEKFQREVRWTTQGLVCVPNNNLGAQFWIFEVHFAKKGGEKIRIDRKTGHEGVEREKNDTREYGE